MSNSVKRVAFFVILSALSACAPKSYKSNGQTFLKCPGSDWYVMKPFYPDACNIFGASK